eukprot:TRINITY_DN4977_c0_g1_i1.p1 TRINITY_DN4977_c0_g1~~TRINITY_DN4977_c0_g1_i1.p1  ORF type:complete len:124 (-),score=46.90 TRINITY_DN4977_c0_g1_i1:155-526(-)
MSNNNNKNFSKGDYSWSFQGTRTTVFGYEEPIFIGLKHPKNAWRGSPGTHDGSALLFESGIVGNRQISHGVAWGDNANGYTLSIVMKDNTVYAIKCDYNEKTFVGSYVDGNLEFSGSVRGEYL